MLWIDFTVESFPDGSFCIKGDTPSEVLGRLYKPGDVFVVNKHGVLKKIDEVNALLLKHETNKEHG